MSLAVLTDSTTAHASPAFTMRPTSGNSTNTTSVNSCCAWSVIPIVAVSPATRTHSCDFAYFRSEGMFCILIFLFLLISSHTFSATTLSCLHARPLTHLTPFNLFNPRPRLPIDRLRHDYRRRALPANRNLHCRPGPARFGRHITHPDADAQRRALRPAGDFAESRPVGAPNRIVRARRRRPIRHLEGDEFPGGAFGALPEHDLAAAKFALALQRDEEA